MKSNARKREGEEFGEREGEGDIKRRRGHLEPNIKNGGQKHELRSRGDRNWFNRADILDDTEREWNLGKS